MSPARWTQVEDLFHRLSDLPPERRRPELEHATLRDPELRAEVESLLAGDRADRPFMDEPALGRGFDLSATPFDAEADAQALDGQDINGYVLVRQIGRGGMGTVYLAFGKDDPARRNVAIKLLRYGAQSEPLRGRFDRERQTLANLDHPYIARWLDGGAARGPAFFGPYFVMEYIEGQPIDRYCDERQLSIADRIKLFRQVCAAVQYAHQHLVVHRDLKPANILVTRDGSPKLLDFGIAKLLTTEGSESESQMLTVPELRLLTPEYASPEQVRGERISTASDVYSLGVILYELLTGRRPYRARTRTPGELERMICDTEPERPSLAAARETVSLDLAASHFARRTAEQIGAARGINALQLPRRLRGDLDNIILTALRKEPQRRYASVEQLSEDLRRYVEGQPITARKDTLGYRASKFVLRNQAAVLAAALVVLSLVGGVIGTAWQAIVASSQRDIAETNLILAEQFKSRAAGAMARARAQAAAARTVSDFLVGLFRMVDPDSGLGKDISAREILERGVAQLEHGLSDQPEIRAELLDTIGRAYTNLGAYDQAAQLLEEAVELRRGRYGSRSRETAESLTSLGDLCRLSGQFERAIGLHREALDFYRSRYGDEHVDVARSLGHIGICVMEKGDPIGAEPYVADGLAMLHRLGDPEPPLRATLLSNLASIKFGRGDFAGSEPLLAESLELRRELYGDEHPKVALALHDLAMARQFIGRRADAEGLFREALAMRRKLLGAEHFNTAITLNSLARLLVERGAYAEAEAALREALGIARSRSAEGDDFVATALRYLALVLLDVGKLDEAEAFAREALEVRRAYFGPEHPNVSTAMNQLARVLLVRGRAAEAESLQRDALAMQRKLLGDRHPDQIGTLRILGRALLEQGDVPAAEANLRGALALSDALFGRRHVAAGLILGDLADAVLAGGDTSAAEGLLCEALDIQRGLLAAPHVDLAATLTRLGLLWTETGRPAEAEALLRESVTMHTDLFPQGNWQTAWAQSALGACLTELGRSAEAEPLIVDSLPIIEATHGAAARRTLEAHRQMARYDDVAPPPGADGGLMYEP